MAKARVETLSIETLSITRRIRVRCAKNWVRRMALKYQEDGWGMVRYGHDADGFYFEAEKEEALNAR